MGGDAPVPGWPLAASCFNPRLRVGGDATFSIAPPQTSVSIHASAWEATPGPFRPASASCVSIHASAWEATPCIRLARAAAESFNPRLRVGGDDIFTTSRPWPQVSIHASAWEATRRLCQFCAGRRVSIHASAWEATPEWLIVRHAKQRRVSIHASAWEATSPVASVCLAGSSFNPRLRVGGELVMEPDSSGMVVSIHASAWEATRALPAAALKLRWVVSIHASAWEATHATFLYELNEIVSIHASAWEATRIRL